MNINDTSITGDTGYQMNNAKDRYQSEEDIELSVNQKLRTSAPKVHWFPGVEDNIIPSHV